MNDEMQTAERALTEFRREISAMAPDAIDLLALERRVQELTSAVGRALMREVMKQADASSPEITIDGECWGNRRMSRGTYTGLFGDIELDRATYQRSGRGRVAVPLELRLGIVEGAYTPRVARILTKAVALMPEAEAEDLLAEVGVANVSKSTLHRVPRAIASRYESRREIIEKALRGRDPIPAQTTTIQVALDGVMVPQDGEHARARGRKSDDPDPPRHEQRYGHVGPEPPSSRDGTLGRAWHEAAVGTVAFSSMRRATVSRPPTSLACPSHSRRRFAPGSKLRCGRSSRSGLNSTSASRAMVPRLSGPPWTRCALGCPHRRRDTR